MQCRLKKCRVLLDPLAIPAAFLAAGNLSAGNLAVAANFAVRKHHADSSTRPNSTANVSKRTANQEKPKNNSKISAQQQNTLSNCASSFNISENSAKQTEEVEASKLGERVRVSWVENSPEVVELESVSAKDLQNLRRERKRTRQVLKEKEETTKASAICSVPIIEISDEEDNAEEEVFERHWSSKICNECGSTVRLHYFTSSPN